MAADYAGFLESKRLLPRETGRVVDPAEINPMLFPFQRDLVRWAVRKGRAGIFSECGTGKTAMQCEFARLTGEPTLILAPLAVAQQTVREAAKFGFTVQYARRQADVGEKIVVTNYQMLDKFDAAKFGTVVLDEAGILKDFEGKTRTKLTETFRDTPYRLCATATPAPNDHTEIGNHAEFLGVMPRIEMLAAFFVHDDNGWRLKKHAREPFYRWVASWAMWLRRPSDLGYDDDGFILPPLDIKAVLVPANYTPPGRLFAVGIGGIGERAKVRRGTMLDRVTKTAQMVNRDKEHQWIIWCGLNDEGITLYRLIEGATLIEGRQTIEEKETRIGLFLRGDARVLITKPSMTGHGLNLQNCTRMAFVGLGDCYDETTEILTHRGWLRFPDVGTDDSVATVNPDTLVFEWQHPTRVIWERYSGPMLHFRGQRNFDLLVTPNHRLFVDRCKVRFPGDKTGWHLEYAAHIADRFRRQEYRMLSAAVTFVGDAPEMVEIPIPENLRVGTRSRIVRSIPAHLFMRLAGWYLTEGYCRPDESAERGRIVICQTAVNQENRREIVSTLESIGLHVNSRTKDITAYSSNLAAFLIDQFGESSRTKRIPGWVKNFDAPLLTILRDTMLKGDGCHDGGGTARAYRTYSPHLMDDFQEICLKTGIRASVKPDWGGLNLAWDSVRPAIHREPETINYDGMIGCVTVPNHVVIVRRNGIPVASGNSYEQYYQCIRRAWRFGQKQPVHVYVVLSDVEEEIYQNVLRKEKEAAAMAEGLVTNVAAFERAEIGQSEVTTWEYRTDEASGRDWRLLLGDSSERLGELAEGSVDLSVYSPPFLSLYTYTPSDRDLGNSRTPDEFWQHYRFIIDHLLRLTKTGRVTCCHVSQVPAMMVRDGYIGLKDFRGQTIAAYEDAGWIYHGEVTVDRDPQAQAIRTHAKGLAFPQLRKDASWMRPALADYILVFRKPGEAVSPVISDVDNDTWIEWARPVWYDVTYRTLNAVEATTDRDERHICALSLDLIERCIRLWSNKGDLVLSPFAGIGSECYQAVKLGRRAVGVELKPEYWTVACSNLRKAEDESTVVDLFSYAGVDVDSRAGGMG